MSILQPQRARAISAFLGMLLWGSSLALPLAAQETLPGVIDLAGSWKFQVGNNTVWSDPDYDDSLWRYTNLPTTWSELRFEDVDGTVSFRRVVKIRGADVERPITNPAIMIGADRYDTFEVYAGGLLVGAYASPFLALPVPVARVFPIPTEAIDADGQVALTLFYRQANTASGQVTGQGGRVGERLLLGELEVLESYAELERLRGLRADVSSAILAALFMTLGLYHLQLFGRRRNQTEYLWFALTTFSAAASIFLVSGWVYELTERYTVIRRLTDASLHLGVPLLIQFLWPFLSRSIGRLLRAYQITHLLLAGAILVMPIVRVLQTESLRWAWTLPFVVAMAVLLGREAWRGSAEAHTIALGGLVLVAAGLGELTYQLLGLGSTFPLPGWAFAYFILAMAVSLSDRFNAVTKELEALRLRLEAMVEDRTEELRNANERLEAEIAERRLAEEAMRMLERAVEQSVDGLAVIDLQGTTQFLNEAWAHMHGYEASEVLGFHLTLFHSPEQLQREVNPCFEKVKETGAFEGEIGHRRKDGTTFPAWMAVSRIEDPHKGHVGYVISCRDITERKQAEEERQELEAKVRQAQQLESLAALAGDIAHDYNNLLTGVLGNASLARSEVAVDSIVGDKIQQIEKAAERAVDLTSQLLAYAGQYQVDPRSFRVNDEIQEMWQTLVKTAASIEVQLHLKDDLPPIHADPAQFRQVILNLVSNAADAIDANEGVITLRTSVVKADRKYLAGSFLDEGQPAGKYVLIGVSDSGHGMNDETRGKMFDPFFTTKTDARGLGLSAVLGIVRAHRGAIKVYSRAGRGTTVEVLFPAADEAADVVTQIPESVAGWRSSGRVLVVDDQDFLRELAQDILQRCGFEVILAEDGPEALELFRQHAGQLRLVLLDRTMPRMDGEEAFREIRLIDPSAQVILMSGFKERDIMESFREDGLAGFLQKPFRPEQLLQKVREVLEA